MTASIAGTPTRSPSAGEVRAACRAGFRAIDEGDDPDVDFGVGFRRYLAGLGFVPADVICDCADRGARGHRAECRWRTEDGDPAGPGVVIDG